MDKKAANVIIEREQSAASARPALVGAGFRLSGGRMARRGRHRKSGAREANGRLSHVELPYQPYLAAHRLRPVDPDAADEQSRATQRGDFNSMKTGCAAARDQNLSFPLGIAYELGVRARQELLSNLITEVEYNARFLITKHEYDAGLEYARLYRLVYGGLRDDIEAALDAAFPGDAVFDLLLGVGRVSAPAQPVSHLRSLVASEPSQHEPLSPEDYQERRESVGHRYAKAYLVLKADYWVHTVVDSVVILGNTSAFLRNGDRILTPDEHQRRTALKKGLGWLSVHFGYEKPVRRPQDRPCGPQASPHGARRVRRGLDIIFGPERDGRPAAEAVSAATDRLLGKSPEDEPC